MNATCLYSTSRRTSRALVLVDVSDISSFLGGAREAGEELEALPSKEGGGRVIENRGGEGSRGGYLQGGKAPGGYVGGGRGMEAKGGCY